MRKEELIPGQMYYMYRPNLGLYELEYVEKLLFKNKLGNIVKLTESQLEFYHDSLDKTHLDYYLNERDSITKAINNIQRDLNNYIKELKELEDKYSYLKNEFPEELI